MDIPKRDWADWGYWAFSLLLVVVGGFQVILLWRTLTAIKRQADTMERQEGVLDQSVKAAKDSAEAALLGAKALIYAERPWVSIFVVPKDGGYSFRAGNLGRTPANIGSFSSECRWLDTIDDLPARAE